MIDRNRMKSSSRHRYAFLYKDLGIILLSILFAITLVKTGVIPRLLALMQGFEFLGSFVAGMFFTSVFTTPPAIAALGEIARDTGILSTVLLGAAGAVIGDLIIFRFVKDRVAEHIMLILEHESGTKRTRLLMRYKFFRWFTFLAGGLIIASPLPDELGVSLLGLSHVKTKYFVVLSFVFNALGIALISIIARAV